MVQDVGSSQGGVKSFDFNSERGVRELLKAIRESDLPQSVRNELRDLVFMYSSGGGDSALRNILEEQVRLYNIVPLAVSVASGQVASVPSSGSGFSGGRPAPVFRPVTVTSATATPVVATPVPPAVEVVVPSIPIPNPIVDSVPVVPTFVSVPVVPPVVTQAPISPVLPVMEPVVPTMPEPVKSVPTPVPSPVVSVPVSEPTIQSSVPNSNELIERIRQIKADVNNRVGNPVNLVDINNEVGREYMTALLEAMKQLNGGDSAAATKAMSRLEEVYIEVKKVVDAAATGSATAPVASPTITAPVIPIIQAENPIISETVTVPDAEPVVKPVVPVEAEISDIEVPIIETELVAPRPKIEIRPPVNPPAPAVVSSLNTDIESVPITSTRFNVSAPVASATPLRTIEELPTTASLKTTSTGDPLYTKDVDEGLQQLLVEWSLFKKSGIFGTGPNGREHPLFKKISPLQIPLLLSGRFEGSTQEIKQSITDYMNGWRYEQGIVYEEGETFEVYLRRVIRHIIDWQNKRPRT